MNLYLVSSAARGIITRQGVGRVKHLQIRTLFLQELHKQGTLSVHPVGTKENTADIGTKPLSGKRIKLLLHWLGFQDENNGPVGNEELQEHRTQEQARASVRMIKSKGNFAFAALSFSAISGISEGLCSGTFSGTSLGTVMLQDRMSADTRSCALGQDVMCSDTSACALGVGTGTVCEASVQEPFVHPQIFSLFKDLGHAVQERCSSHSSEGPESLEGTAGEDSEEEAKTMVTQIGRELKALMEKQSEEIGTLSADLKALRETVKELVVVIGEVKSEVQELQQRWSEFIEEEEVARTEYGKYFEEQEKYKQELRADRDRLLEKELRMEGHLGPASSTSPTRTEIHEFSDRPYFDAITQESEAQESMEENEDEHYTQSFEYISEEEAGEPWQEEEEYTGEEEQPEEDKEQKKKQSQEEYDAERKVLLEKARAQIAEKQAKRQEQERGFKTPIDKSHDWKFYTENGYKQNYRTGEKIWWNYDYKYKRQKGKGKQEFEKTGKGKGRPHQPFQPRDAEDAAYWEKMGKLEEEKRRKREEAKAAAEEEERQKQKARETLERAAEENDRREAEAKAQAEAERKRKEEAAAEAEAAAAVKEEKARKAAAAEEQKRRKAAAAAEERKKMEAEEAGKRKEKESKEQERIKELEKQLAELKGGKQEPDAGEEEGEEGKTEDKEQASSSSTEDPEAKAKGPTCKEGYVRGAPKFEAETDRNFYAVFPYDGNDYQWKWNSDTCYWYFFDFETRRWVKQEGKDVKGKQVCLTQEQRWSQAKGKKGKGKNKGKQEEEENYSKYSPEYDYVEAADTAAAAAAAKKGGEPGSSSVDPHFQ